MKLDFNNKKAMDIGTGTFNFVRVLMDAPTGGAEIDECLLAAARIKDNDRESWIRQWWSLGEKTLKTAEQAMQRGWTIPARQAYLRANNYFRAAIYYVPYSDARLNSYIKLSRECFQQAAKLFSPAIEAVEIPFGTARLPGYFLAAGQPQSPTLIAMNGLDSTNEEMVHWVGFAAVARGWNFLTFEGPGQWGALQMNPALYMRQDFEAPTKAVVDYLIQRNEVDPDRIALIGYSWGAQFAVRAVAFEKRIRACIASGLVIDTFDAWAATTPAVMRSDLVFSWLEKSNLQLFGVTNSFRRALGVSGKPHELFEAVRPYTVSDTASKLQCPLLLLYGEAEYAQSNEAVALKMLRYLSELTCPITYHEFRYEAGWAASHCQIGGLSLVQTVIFDWLEKTVNTRERLLEASSPQALLMNKYLKSRAAKKLLQGIRLSLV
ncbi:MAG: alpha/beta hydrolase [Caldilineaceae bacterium]